MFLLSVGDGFHRQPNLKSNNQVGKHVCEEVERLLLGERMKCEIDLTKLSQMA